MARKVGGVFILPIYAAAPGSPAQGQVYFDSVLGYARIYNGTKWVPLGGLA